MQDKYCSPTSYSFPEDFVYKSNIAQDNINPNENNITNNNSSSLIKDNPDIFKILLFGLKKTGKSSVFNVIFNNIPPSETYYLESTTNVTSSPLIDIFTYKFVVYDFPAPSDALINYDINLIKKSHTLILIIDVQQEFNFLLKNCFDVITFAYKLNKKLRFEIFVHKSDELELHQREESLIILKKRILAHLKFLNLSTIQIDFHLTSIYECSIYEAFSKVIQKLIPNLNKIELMIKQFTEKCGVDTVLLIDTASKLYLATNMKTVDMQTYELCCNAIKMILDFKILYDTSKSAADISYKKNVHTVLLNNFTIDMREINKFLYLIYVVKAIDGTKKAFIEYNMNCLTDRLIQFLSE